MSIDTMGTWREKKSDVTSDSDDNDDGYSNSDESNRSAHKILTARSESSASKTSGISSNGQRENGNRSNNGDADGSTSHNHEIVNKMLISQEVNNAIFEPGILFFL